MLRNRFGRSYWYRNVVIVALVLLEHTWTYAILKLHLKLLKLHLTWLKLHLKLLMELLKLHWNYWNDIDIIEITLKLHWHYWNYIEIIEITWQLLKLHLKLFKLHLTLLKLHWFLSNIFETNENVWFFDFSSFFRKCFPVSQEVVGIKKRPEIKF